ncbi:beta-defensin 11-like [Arvicanthis niloticus]|uniref:beta-defensin 11-like n=1 Tax=Arvicanthis niloticus TaxID=61156 RepID=UPI001486242C|nr:beta-defensin 11-like [Arvicanthis niloticus]
MRTLCSVLLICCLLFSSTTPALGNFYQLIRQKQRQWCLNHQAYCLVPMCPPNTMHLGGCEDDLHCCKDMK